MQKYGRHDVINNRISVAPQGNVFNFRSFLNYIKSRRNSLKFSSFVLQKLIDVGLFVLLSPESRR